MSSAAVSTLVLIAAIAVIAPIISELSGKLGVPEVVIQLGLGILVGPYVLGLAQPTGIVSGLADMGLAYLMFLAGYELDLARIRGRPLSLAAIGWIMSVATALGAAFVLVYKGIALDTVVVGLALTTTALGTLLPVLRDAGVFETEFGKYVLAVGTVGEFGPVVAVALLLTSKQPLATSGLLVLFFVIAVAAGV
jgi:Kef-type K+ transport system membrane component KefB